MTTPSSPTLPRGWTESTVYHTECDHCGQGHMVYYGTPDRDAAGDLHEALHPGHDVWAISPVGQTLSVHLPGPMTQRAVIR